MAPIRVKLVANIHKETARASDAYRTSRIKRDERHEMRQPQSYHDRRLPVTIPSTDRALSLYALLAYFNIPSERLWKPKSGKVRRV